MNERIKELWEECKTPNWSYDTQTYDQAKFAELIVRECIAKVSEWDMGIDHTVGATDNTSQVARDMVAEIKDHFGVK